MNKRNNTIRGVLLLVAAALMFSSCAETPGPEEEVTDTRTISFGTPALTRSAIDNAGDMQKEENAFSVWGWYANAGGTESGTVFNNKRVFWSAANPGWGYEDTRYWHPGLDYRFYALYPSTDKLGTGVNAACAVNGTITITNFDATHGTDLMTAQQTVQTPDVLTKDPGPVTFTFAHLCGKSRGMRGDGHSLQGERRDLEGQPYLSGIGHSLVERWRKDHRRGQPADQSRREYYGVRRQHHNHATGCAVASPYRCRPDRCCHQHGLPSQGRHGGRPHS